MFRFNKILAVLCLVILSTSVNARRRSRIDLPIKNASDVALEDNIASTTAEQQQQPQTEATSSSLPMTTIQSDISEDNDLGSSESTSSEELQDCDNIDNISFELVTGWVFKMLTLTIIERHNCDSIKNFNDAADDDDDDKKRRRRREKPFSFSYYHVNIQH